MVEMTAMCNYTGLVPDVIGGHGPKTSPGTEGIKELNQIFKLKKDGGILNKHGVVEYVDGVAPGVFVTVSTPQEEVAYQMDYLLMGPGPLWTLYRPYHLCSLETPLTVAKLVIDGEVQCAPIDGLVAECITRAKTDLKAGQTIDGIGGYTTYGSICEASISDANRYVPYGLVTDNAVMKRDVKKGQLITLDDIILDTNTYVYKLRQEQDKIYGKTNLFQ
jgi:predicted homoserine dehydrogenase-like protein